MQQLFVKKTLTAAEVLAGAPIAFGLTVPSGYYVNPVSLQCGVDYNSIPFATNLGVGVRCVGADEEIAAHSTALDTNVARIVSLPINIYPTADHTQFIDGADVEVFFPGGTPATGNSPVDFYMIYFLTQL